MVASGEKSSSSLHIPEDTDLLRPKKRKPKLKSHENFAESVNKGAINSDTYIKKRPYKKQKPNLKSKHSCKDIDKHEDGEVKRRRRRRKKKRRRDDTEVDEGSRLQRRTRYLLVRMKLEQNLIDAYDGEGWKGQSREKIKPDKELQRAKKQILKCKLGIRDAIRQLDLLSSVGSMENSVIAPDGSVHHENIICAKCKLQEAFPDNDIILCDGTCNCGFHQKCLDPPLLSENIPPGDQGWFCKFCESKMAIIETTNVHLGTHFSAHSHWQDIFRDEAAFPDNGGALEEQEWPSDDSEDDDYDPNKIENDYTHSRAGSGSDGVDDVSSATSTSLCSVEEEVLTPVDGSINSGFDVSLGLNIGVDSDASTDCKILNGPRQRRAVDYTKLYDEMFGKDAPVVEQNSEDEDWGPVRRRKKRAKESDAASTLMSFSDSNQKLKSALSTEDKESRQRSKRQNFRIPPDAVEKLRLAFAENELPSREARESISKELGIDYEKINKWFKNARYMALKCRKGDKGNQIQNTSPKLDDSNIKIESCKAADHMSSKDLAPAEPIDLTADSRENHRRNHSESIGNSAKKKSRKKSLQSRKKADEEEIGDNVSLKLFQNLAKKKKSTPSKPWGRLEGPEAELERLFKIKDKVERLQNTLHRYQKRKPGKKSASVVDEHDRVIYVPVAELVEKQ